MLSQKAEDTLNQFAAVKKAEVNFQTSLGNRKGQLGINLIGAFAERQNNAFGWQVRVYGAQQDGKGFNAGVFYRHITDNVLIGANAFVDYENHKLGNFYRYSIGGEAQNRYGSFAANYYVPITDEKRKDGGVIFSRKGYDAKLRLNIPNAKFLKAAVDYYNFGNEHGAESDDGFRYGAEAHLIPGLRLGVFYDNGGEELGGEVSYIHTIGEVQQSQTANEQWTPDLFAAVSREHSQRIVSVSVSAGNVSLPPPIFSAFAYSGTVGFSATIGVISIVADYFSNTATATIFNPLSPEELMTASNGTLIWAPATRGAKTLSVAVSNLPPSQTATLLITTDIALAESARVASVGATILLRRFRGQNPASGFNDDLITIANKILATLPPASANRPYVLTTNLDLDSVTAVIIDNFGGAFAIGQMLRILEIRSRRAGVIPYTLTIVQGSEEYQSTLYAQVDIDSYLPLLLSPLMPKMAIVDSRIPPSFPPMLFPPSLPIMTELAFAKEPRSASITPLPFVFVRRKGFAAKPPPLVL